MRFFLLIRNWIIYILLAGAAVFFGHQTVKVWSAENTPRGGPPVRKPLRPQAAKRTHYRRAPHYKTYEVIPQKNLFASDRREKLLEKPETAPPDTPSKPPGNKLALFGIVIKGHEKKALVSNLNKKKGDKNEQHIWVTIGDKLGNYEVTGIKPEELIITQGDSAYTVRLSDRNHPEKRAILKRLPRRTATSKKKRKK